MQKLHIIYCPFTGVGLNSGFRGQDWYHDRIEVFKRYTLASLENCQTLKKSGFMWLSFRPQERNNRLTIELSEYLLENRFRFVMTFDGLMYYDDKFALSKILLNLGRVIRGWGRTKKVRFSEIAELFTGRNRSLPYRLLHALSVLDEKLPRCEWVYMTRIDSDDLLHRDALNEILNTPPEDGLAITMKNGYVVRRMAEGYEIAEWRPKTNPPFHTLVFPAWKFFDPTEHLRFYRGYKSHEDIPKLFKTRDLRDGLYCVGIHNNHISTLWEHPFRGQTVNSAKAEEFGLSSPQIHYHPEHADGSLRTDKGEYKEPDESSSA